MSKRPRARSHSADREIHLPLDAPVIYPEPPTKYTQLDATYSSPVHTSSICCTLPPHEPLAFDTYDDYELHYHKSHVNRCLVCKRNFPTNHYLSLHIIENHDPLSAIRRERGDKTFSCFVEGCEKVCSTPQKRRMHLVDKHMFPKEYDFFVVNHGIDTQFSMLRSDHNTKKNNSRPPQVAKKTNPPENDNMGDKAEIIHDEPLATDAAMNDVVTSMASLKFVPKSVTFGRNRQHAGFAKK